MHGMASPLMSLLAKSTIIIILFLLFLFILSCIIIIMVGWRIAWLSWYHHHNIAARNGSFASSSSSSSHHQPSLPSRGLDKTILRSLPRIAYNANVNGKLSECAICLMEYVDGDAIRVLPHCGHTFHMNCVDRWLKCHSSCPSCRHILAIGRPCQKCTGF
ncbi:RING-H2 finger protein ATL8 [Ziziphus jujuba]|uniref:RING-H2 finger protein ATL8 n=1 Tax=Ziziphus jujuba TaxID=326968 RepID=A0A6P4AV50_ZIZJJ|nr:RING-H2 finger protein ATL8 [Ziziphus jujuba]